MLLFQFVLINISASLHAWKQTHFYTDPSLRIVKPSSRNIFIKTWKLFSGLKYPRSVIWQAPPFPVDTIQFKTNSGLIIDCWYSRTDSIPKGTVILIHQLTVNKSYILHEASEFRYYGYNVMMVDLRGHGNSAGNVTTLGFRESEEIKLAWDYLQQKAEKRIFLWGASLGAVAIAKAVSDYNLNPSGLILEMPFSSLQSHLEGKSRFFGFPEEPFGFLVTAWVGIERGFNGFKHKTTDYVKKIACPVLLQWGTRDPFVLKQQIESIYDNIPGNNKRLVVYTDADHQSLLGFDPVKWREEVNAMLKNPAGIHQ
jgi:uncharacterized protein